MATIPLPTTAEDVELAFSKLLDWLLRDPTKAILMARLFRSIEEDTSIATAYAELFESWIHAETAPRPDKQPIPPALRWKVWARDDFRCHYCGSRYDLSVDHIVPEANGGPLRIGNLVTACRSCNVRKGTRSYADFVDGLHR